MRVVGLVLGLVLLLTGAAEPSAARAVSGGCAANRAVIPAHALRATVPDVDGDGRADTEWAELREGGTVHFGVRTASGAVIGAAQPFAGGADRSYLLAHLAAGPTIALVSEYRATALWVLSSCGFRPVRGAYDAATDAPGGPFFFSDEQTAGAAGCVRGRLAGIVARTPRPRRVTISARWVEVDAVHATARVTGSAVLVRDASDSTDAEAARLQPWYRIFCGGAPALHPVAVH